MFIGEVEEYRSPSKDRVRIFMQDLLTLSG